MVRQFAYRIVYLHFISFGMRFVYVLLHEGRAEERIVDMRIHRIAVMQVDNVCSCFSHNVYSLVGVCVALFQFLGRLVSVVVAVGPLLHRVDGLEGSYQYQEVEVQLFALLEGTAATLCLDVYLVSFLLIADAAFTVVKPGWRHVQRLHFVEVCV